MMQALAFRAPLLARGVAAGAVRRAALASAPAADPPRAAMLVIGNEVLSGAVADANTPWLAKLLFARGVDLVRVVVCPDDEADIGASVLDLRRRVGPGGYVFTSGGIGATHDDVTYAAVAAALGVPLAEHAPTLEAMKVHYEAKGLELNAARRRMAALPAGCEVLATPGLWVPLAVAGGNVHVLPGIPRLFQAMVSAAAAGGRFAGPALHGATLFGNMGEGELAERLAAVAAAHPDCRIGSYPNVGADARFKVKLRFEGRDAAAVGAAAAAARAAIPGLFELAEG